MRLKDLQGLPVIDPTAARRIGTVADYQVDPVAGRLAAIDVEPTEHAQGRERILGHRVRRVGRHAVVLTAIAGSAVNAAAELNERWLDTSTLVGLEVMGDDGDRIGRLADAVFDQDSLDIQHYLLRSSSFLDELTGGRGRIQPSKVHSCSRQLMIVQSGKLAEESTAPEAAEESLGVPLKVEDKVPAPAPSKVEDGQPVTAKR